jgi:hypothetical protein
VAVANWIFAGPKARDRAIGYANPQYGAFKEVACP